MSDMRDKDLPPTRTIEPMTPPPDSARPTSAMLKGDINSGRTGDKNPVYDPGLSPLGTDDEAAGHPPGPARVGMARRLENLKRWSKGARKTGAAHNKVDGPALLFVAFIGAIALALVVGIVGAAHVMPPSNLAELDPGLVQCGQDPQLLLVPPLAPPLYPGDDLHRAPRCLSLPALERTPVKSKADPAEAR